MPTSESADVTAGRVTRSLRKRLTSADSDASSRPETPIINSLQTISETVTPSKRVTRRTSISTPTATPLKAKGRLESSEISYSPARRQTRRRSVSVQEQEYLPVQAKSKEQPRTVKEEKTPEVESRRITRSSSRSPLELLIVQSKLNTLKASAKKLLEKSTEQEEVIINLDDSNEDVAATSPTTLNKKQTKVMIKKEKNIDEMVVEQASPSNQSDTGRAQKKNTSVHEENIIEGKLNLSKLAAERRAIQKDSNKKMLVTIERSTSEKIQVEHRSPRKSESVQKQDRSGTVESSPSKTLTKPLTSQDDGRIKDRRSVELISSAKKNVSEVKKDLITVIQSSPAKTQPEEGSPQKKKNRPEKLKNVAFDGTADEDSIKSVYPKTPGLTKSKSYILDSTNDAEKEISIPSADNARQSITEDENKSDKEVLDDEDPEMVSTKTPYKLKLKAVESSTPIQSASPMNNKTSAVKEQKEVTAKENEETDDVFLFPKSWSQSISGTVNEIDIKIDTIKSEESMRKKLEEEEALKKSQSFTSQNQSKGKTPRDVFDDTDDDDDDMLEEDDVCDQDMEEEEEGNREKTIFVDDEAMEVPEGEESMDSEERAYLEENEVPVYGESIGSEDSEDEDYEEEVEEEDDGFIVSDSEDIVHIIEESDSNDGIEKNPKGRKYKRIAAFSESSNEGENPIKTEDKDFCLILESSLEEEKHKRKGDVLEKNNDKEEISSKANIDEGSPNIGKSLKNKQDSDKGDPSETSKVGTPNKNVSLKKAEEEEEEKEDTLNRRKSFKNKEGNDKVEKVGVTGETSKVGTPNKRMSLKKTEEEEKEDTPNRRKSLKSKEGNDKVEKVRDTGETSKVGTPNKKMSLKKTEEEEKEDTPNRRKSLRNKEDNNKVEKVGDTGETSKVGTPTNRMSLKETEEEKKEDTPNKKKSLKDKEDNNKVQKVGDTGETSKVGTPTKRMSLKKTEEEEKEDTPNRRKSLKNKEDNNKVEKVGDTGETSKVGTPTKRMSLKKTEEEKKEDTPNKKKSLKDKEDNNKVEKVGDTGETSKVGTPTKRMSLKKTEEEKKEDTTNKKKSLKDKEDNNKVEKVGETGKTSKVGTPTNRMSLKKTEEEKKEDTPNKKKSLKDKEDNDKVEKIGTVGETSKVGTPNKRMSLKKAEEEENETKIDEDDGEEVSKKTRKKSLNKAEVNSETNRDSETETKGLSKKERKSLNSSKKNKTVEEDIEMEVEGAMTASHCSADEDEEEAQMVSSAKTPKKSRKSLNKSKPDISQSEYDLEGHADETSTLQTSYRTSISDEHHEHIKTATSAKQGSINKGLHGNEEHLGVANTPRKELKMSLHQSIVSPKEDHNNSKSISKKSLNRNNSEFNDCERVESPRNDKNTSLNQASTSLNSTADDKNLKEKSRKSANNSKAGKNVIENEEEAAGPKKENLNLSRKSLNDSKNEKRKSLIRTSTEEANDEKKEEKSLQNRSKLEKSFQSHEDSSEPEETLSASEGRSLNSSRRSRKSLNRSKQSLENDDEVNISRERLYEDDEQEPEETELNRPQRMSANLKVASDSEGTASEAEEDNEENPQDDSDDDDEGDEACFSDAEVEEQHKNAAERSSMMEFLGEEEYESQPAPESNRNSSCQKSVNKSKLDETFEMESKGNSVSMHESLHRSIMRKSLNQSQLRREAIEKNENSMDSDENEANYSDNLVDSSVEEGVEVIKKVLPERGLSVSLSNIEFKNKKVKGDEKAIRNSFTIGVSVRNAPSIDKAPDAGESESEQQDLKNVKDVQHIGPNKLRKSMSTSLKVAPLTPEDIMQQKRIKCQSLYAQEQTASQSLVENIADVEKNAQSKRKRHSNSFCGVIVPSVEEEMQHDSKSERKQKKSSESEDKKDIQRILSRCDEILEAANRAKRDEKLKAKKTKVKKPKWMDKEEKTTKEEGEVKIPLVSRKALKRKEKIKKELAKAIKHSTAMLKTIDPKLGKKLKATQITETEQTDNKPSSSKRLPMEFLEALEQVPLPKKKKSKEVETTPPSDKENSKKSSKKATYTVTDIPVEKKKKKPDREVLETATGTVIVEPSTPVKLRYQHGFRESPKTPVGFKVQDVYSAGQNESGKSRKHRKKLFTPSGEFIEEDLCVSNAKANSKREKTHKRKRHIEEPLYSLPKTQWTPSGVFVEEDLYSARPLANSTATQFMVTSLNGGKKIKNLSKVVSSTTLSSALSFKQSTLFNDTVQRETSRELIYRKQRKIINNQY